MSELEKFESDMLRLCTVWIRLMTVYDEFPKLTETGQHASMVRNVFREYTVINLVSFIKVRRDLVKHDEFKKLDDVIKPLIAPILKYEGAIFELRNQHLAHVQEEGRKFEVMINDILLKYNFPTNFGFYRYLAGLVFFYSGNVERNFKEVWDKALIKYNAKGGGSITISSGFEMKDTDKKFSELLKPIAVKLFDDGFISPFTNEQIEKVKEELEKKS
ncbi:MAG: hypothetical protein HKM23_09645 [Nitrosopumilus sp.]|nr:hypothetical protein [Nitrosopumilus sp.]